MSTGSKLIVAAAIVTLGLASAFAQSFNRTDGTGNTRRLTMTVKVDCTPVSQPQQPSEKPKDND